MTKLIIILPSHFPCAALSMILGRQSIKVSISAITYLIELLSSVRHLLSVSPSSRFFFFCVL